MRLFSGFGKELQFAWRSIVRQPLLTGVIVASLAVGIGVNTAVFSWVQAVVVRPLPGVRNPGRFELLEPRTETGSNPGASWLEYQDLQRLVHTAVDPLAFRATPLNIGEPERNTRTYGLLVSGNYFSALGLRPLRGRLLSDADAARPGGEPVLVISYGLWQSRFAGASDVVGRELRVNGLPLTIVGVAPERFQGTVLSVNFDLWVPATLAPALFSGSRELVDRSLRGYTIMTELQPHTTRQQAQFDLDRTMRELANAFPETNRKMQGEVLPFWQAPRGPQRMLAGAVATLQGVVLLLLLAVCGNTANLLLARTSVRRREIGVRLALGAGRWQVVRALATENLMLAGFGTLAGTALAWWATDALRAVPVIAVVPIRFQTDLDGTSLAFAGLLGMGSAVLFGSAPAIQLARLDPAAVFRSGVQAAGRSRMRHTLMGIEVGLAMLVLIAAGLFLRTFRESRDTDPGFQREGVLLAAYDFTGRNLGEAGSREFARRLLERLRALPEVESAAIATSVPLDIHGLPMRSFSVEGRAKSDASPDVALANTVTPGYFATMGIPILAGRDFADLGDPAAPAQAIVNEEFARRYIGAGERLGRWIETRGRKYVVTAVVRNSIGDAFGESIKPTMYLSYRDRPAGTGEIHVRTRPGSESLLAPSIEHIVRELDPALPVYDVRTLADHVDKNLFLLRIPARMFAVLGPLLLVLAAVGIYAVVAYAVSQRTGEIALRLALGATNTRLVSQIALESFRVVAVGAAAGWTFAFLVKVHLVRGPLYLSVFGGVPALVLAVAGLACWFPARRATEVEPNAALREL
jgi:predicted permease